jgi:restriction system protein
MARRRKKADSFTLIAIVFIAGLGAVVSYPYVFLAIGALALLGWLLFRWLGRQEDLSTYDLSEIDNMEGEEFEEYVAALFRKLGYQALVTQQSRDFGVDVVAKRGGERIAIQVKRYSKAVSLGGVQQAVAGMHKYNCNKAMVVTNNYFTPSAQELASHSSCELIDRDGLACLIRQAQKTDGARSCQSGQDQERPTNSSSNSVVVACNGCGQKLRLVAGRSGNVKCPSCEASFFVST